MRGPCTAMRSGPRLPQLEKALAQKRRPNTAINKLINLKKKSGTPDIHPTLKKKKEVYTFKSTLSHPSFHWSLTSAPQDEQD